MTRGSFKKEPPPENWVFMTILYVLGGRRGIRRRRWGGWWSTRGHQI